MNSAEDNLPARAAVAIGDLVGTTGLDGHGRNAHQIDAGVVKANSVTQMFEQPDAVTLRVRICERPIP